MGLTVVALIGAAIIAVIVMRPKRRRARRRALRRRAFPEDWHRLLWHRFGLYRHLPGDLRRRLQGIVHVLVAEKEFVGGAAFHVSEEMKVLIAAQAALLVLNRGDDEYDSLRTIVVHPGAFWVDGETRDDAGVHTPRQRALTGESWEQGRVVLSWDDVEYGARKPGDGFNVVLHEFAHQLDQESGFANGAPALGSREEYARWSRILGREYQQLCDQVSRGDNTVIDPYGSENPAEFFAVATEAFFERSRDLQARHPELYAVFKAYYRLDPADWGEAA